MSRRDNSAATPYDLIYQFIVEGHYAPGQRLIEQRIAEELNVSRTPVREALRQLESSGLVVTERNRGSVVREVTREEIVDLYELRARLEGLAAERAATRADAEDLAAMDEAVQAFGAALRAPDIRDLEALRDINRANRAFHDTVLRAARHDRLAQLLRVTVDAPLVFQSFSRFDRARSERSHEFHQLIRDAIARREPQRASRLMMEHIDQGRDVLLGD
jgi:DNA-binding GntR family transcriptional regulator